MITVYRIHFQIDDFQYLLPVDPDLGYGGKLWLDGKSYRKRWKPPEFYIYKPRLKLPDLWRVAPFYGGIGMSRELYSAWDSPMLDRAGEMLPINLPGRDLLLLNVMNVINCLDRKIAKFDPDLNSVEDYAFIPSRIDQSIFKIPETAMAEIFVAEGLMDPEDEFKAVVEARKLKGLYFEKVWSGGSSKMKVPVGRAKLAPRKPQAKSKSKPKSKPKRKARGK